MTNTECLELVLEYQRTKDSELFEYIWENTHRMVNIKKYYDPSGALDSEDFIQFARIGLWKALEKYKVEARAKPLSWISTLMEQNIIREVKRLSRALVTTSLDSAPRVVDGETRTVEEMIYKAIQLEYQDASQQWNEEVYNAIINRVYRRISDNLKVAKCFQLKLAFPQMSRDLICKILKISRPAVGQYFKQIRTVVEIEAGLV